MKTIVDITDSVSKLCETQPQKGRTTHCFYLVIAHFRMIGFTILSCNKTKNYNSFTCVSIISFFMKKKKHNRWSMQTYSYLLLSLRKKYSYSFGCLCGFFHSLNNWNGNLKVSIKNEWMNVSFAMCRTHVVGEVFIEFIK